MHYRRLGSAGIKVSEISLGSWITFGNQVDDERGSDLVHAAYDQGVNFFDNADVYASGRAEIVMGKAVKDLPRSSFLISTKTFFPTMPGPNGRGLSRKHITDSIHASLKRLDVEYIDLYFCHRYDPDTPLEEVVRMMNDLIQQGKILYWGTSEWEAYQIAEAFGIARQFGLQPPSMEQSQYNLFRRDRFELHLAPMSKEIGLGIITCSPLYSGILSGKYNLGVPSGSRATLPELEWVRELITPQRIATVRQLGLVAREMGITPAQLAIAWILRRKEVSSVITGTTSPEQLDENLVAAEVVDKLTDDVLEIIEKTIKNIPE